VPPKGVEAKASKLWVAPATPVTRWRPLNTEDLGNYLEKPRGWMIPPLPSFC